MPYDNMGDHLWHSRLYNRTGDDPMRYMIKLGEGTSYEDHRRMIENQDLGDAISASMSVVDKFKKQFPTVPIDEVQLTINKTGEITTDIKEIELLGSLS